MNTRPEGVLVQSVASDTEPVHGVSPRLIPAGRPGVQAASVIVLARSILVTRLFLAAVYAAAALALNGVAAESLPRYAVPFLVIAGVTLAETLLLSRLASGPPRIVLVLADSAVAVVIFLVWTADPVYVIYQMGSAALIGTLLGLQGTALWGGQALQAAVTCWVVLSDKVAPPLTTIVLVTAPALIVAAGASAVIRTRIVQDRLNRDLDPARPVHEIYEGVARTLRSSSIAWFRPPRLLRRRRPELADELARVLTQDVLLAAERSAVPVNGIQFDRPHEDFADPLELMCRRWAREARVTLHTDLPPVWLRITARHQLALIVDDALNNIADHARATRAQVELAERRQAVTLTIKDNGQGFTVPADPAVLRGGDYEGLCRMISRSAYLGADLTITTAPYSGTEIKVRMPA